MIPRDRRDLRCGVAAHTERYSCLGGKKARELTGAIANHRNAERLQPLPGRSEIQDRLRARTDDNHARPRQLEQIRRFVTQLGTPLELPAGAAMHTADATGREHVDLGLSDEDESGRDGDCSIRPLRNRLAQVATSHLAHAVATEETLQILAIE